MSIPAQIQFVANGRRPGPVVARFLRKGSGLKPIDNFQIFLAASGTGTPARRDAQQPPRGGRFVGDWKGRRETEYGRMYGRVARRASEIDVIA